MKYWPLPSRVLWARPAPLPGTMPLAVATMPGIAARVAALAVVVPTKGVRLW
ncbi:hypothetical protein D3C77_625190 [compost metagenome]